MPLVDKCKQASTIETPSVSLPRRLSGVGWYIERILKLNGEGYRSIMRLVHQTKAPTASMQTCYHSYANGVDDADAHEFPRAHVS